MQPIEGIDLGEVYREVEKEVLAEKRKGVAKKVSGIALNLQQWRLKDKELEKESAKYKKKIARAEETLKGILEGKWELLEDDNPQKNQNQAGKNQAAESGEDD